MSYPPKPPLPAGSTLGGAQDGIAVHPVFYSNRYDQHGLRVVDHWKAVNFAAENLHSLAKSHKSVKFSNTSEIFLSNLHAFWDANSSHHKSILFGSQHIYTFEIADDVLSVVEHPAPYRNGQHRPETCVTFFGLFSPGLHSDKLDEEPQKRVLYAHQTKYQQTYIRDLLDDKLVKEFPVQIPGDTIKNFSKFQVNKETYCIFLMIGTDVASDMCRMYAYVASEEDVYNCNFKAFQKIEFENDGYRNLVKSHYMLGWFSSDDLKVGNYFRKADGCDQIAIKGDTINKGSYVAVYNPVIKDKKISLSLHNSWQFQMYQDFDVKRSTYPAISTSPMFNIMNSDGTTSLVVQSGGWPNNHFDGMHDKNRVLAQLDILRYDFKKQKLLRDEEGSSVKYLQKIAKGSTPTAGAFCAMPWSKIWPVYELTKDKKINLKKLSLLGVNLTLNATCHRAKFAEQTAVSNIDIEIHLDKDGEYCFASSVVEVSKIVSQIDLGIEYNDPRFSELIDFDRTTVSSMKNFDLPKAGFCYFAQTDLLNRQVTLGTPVATQYENRLQLFAQYLAIPYEKSRTANPPNFMFSSMSSEGTGMTTSTNDSWSTSLTVHGGVHEGGAYANASVGGSYGEHTTKTDGDHTTTMLHEATGLQQEDGIHGVLVNCTLWEYPIVNVNSPNKPTEFVTFLVSNPDARLGATFHTSSDTRIPYYPTHENGMLLTYLDYQRTDFDSDNLWFETKKYPVPADSVGTSVSYDKNNTTQKDSSYSYNFGVNVSASFGYNGTFWNVGVNAHYNMNSSNNTNQSVVKTTDTSLSFHTGGVADPGFEYSFAPYVYTEKSSGRIVLDYDVDLYGAMWKQSYKTPDLICIRISPFSQYPYLSTYTRDIRFKEIGDDGLEVSVLVFNNSFSDCKGGSIKIGMGEPDISKDGTIEMKPDELVAELHLDTIPPVGRGKASVKIPRPPQNTKFYVELRITTLQAPSKYYWNIYPDSAMSHIDHRFKDLEIAPMSSKK